MSETRESQPGANGSPHVAGRNRRSDFYAAVFAMVSQIPAGRVTTYGTIAQT
nr:MGMT family protein [Chloroflexia bacterium]